MVNKVLVIVAATAVIVLIVGSAMVLKVNQLIQILMQDKPNQLTPNRHPVRR